MAMLLLGSTHYISGHLVVLLLVLVPPDVSGSSTIPQDKTVPPERKRVSKVCKPIVGIVPLPIATCCERHAIEPNEKKANPTGGLVWS